MQRLGIAVRRGRRRRPGSRRSRGFTLIEILVTFAVVAILLGLAAPSFVTFQRNSELTSTANAFVAGLSAGRAEAMKRQRDVFVVPAANDDWATGWIVFVDANANQVYDSGTDTVVLRQGPIPGTVTLTGSDNFVDAGAHYALFSGSGFMRLKTGGFKSSALDLTNGSETRRVIANPAGRLRVCKPADAGCNTTDL